MNTQFLITYMDAAINNDHAFFKNQENIADKEEFFNRPFDEWDVIDEDPLLLLELLTLSELANSLIANKEDGVDDTLLDVEYLNVFGTSFMDVDPTTRLSVAGWINLNFSRQHEERYGSIPSSSLFNIVEFIKETIDASPTSDETLPEHILARITEAKTSNDLELLEQYIYTEMNDHCFALSKIINIHGGRLLATLDKSNPDDMTISITSELISTLVDTCSAIDESVDPKESLVHAISLVTATIDRLTNTMLSISEG